MYIYQKNNTSFHPMVNDLYSLKLLLVLQCLQLKVLLCSIS